MPAKSCFESYKSVSSTFSWKNYWNKPVSRKWDETTRQINDGSWNVQIKRSKTCIYVSFDCVDQIRLRTILKAMNVLTHFIVLVKNLYSVQEAVVPTETVDVFAFLGASMSVESSSNLEIRRRFDMCKAAMGRLIKIMKDRGIRIGTKFMLVDMLGSPTVLYGSESWMMRKAERRFIDSFEL